MNSSDTLLDDAIQVYEQQFKPEILREDIDVLMERVLLLELMVATLMKHPLTRRNQTHQL